MVLFIFIISAFAKLFSIHDIKFAADAEEKLEIANQDKNVPIYNLLAGSCIRLAKRSENPLPCLLWTAL